MEKDIGTAESQLEEIRNAKDSENLRDSVALLSIHLLDSFQRDNFDRCDGLTTVVDHLERVWQEKHAAAGLDTFGFKLSEAQVADLVCHLLMCVCHLTLHPEMTLRLGDTNLVGLLQTKAQETQHIERICILEILRNFFYHETNRKLVEPSFLEDIWYLALRYQRDPQTQELALLILINLAADDPKLIQLSSERLSRVVGIYFSALSLRVKIAAADLICNLARDREISVLFVCELDERKPLAYKNHSGIVYVLELCEKIQDEGLKQATDAMSHNLALTDPAKKRRILRAGASSLEVVTVDLTVAMDEAEATIFAGFTSPKSTIANLHKYDLSSSHIQVGLNKLCSIFRMRSQRRRFVAFLSWKSTIDVPEHVQAQLDEYKSIVKQLRAEILELHEENSKLTIESQHEDSPRSTDGAAVVPFDGNPKADGGEGIPELLNAYFVSFKRLFNKFSKPDMKSAARVMNIEAWMGFCRIMTILSRISRRKAQQIFAETSTQGAMDFGSFIEALVEISNSTYSSVQELTIYPTETDRLLMLLMTIKENFNADGGNALFPNLHSRVKKLHTLQKERTEAETQGHIEKQRIIPLSGSETSQKMLNMQVSLLDPLHNDIHQVIGALNQVLGKRLDGKLHSVFLAYCTTGDNESKYLSFMKYIRLLKDKKLMRSKSTLGIINLVFDKAIKRESIYLFQKRNGQTFQSSSSTVSMQDRVHMQRMSYNAFKLSVADLAQRTETTQHGLSSEAFRQYIMRFVTK